MSKSPGQHAAASLHREKTHEAAVHGPIGRAGPTGDVIMDGVRGVVGESFEPTMLLRWAVKTGFPPRLQQASRSTSTGRLDWQDVPYVYTKE